MVIVDISEFERKAMLKWGVKQWLESNDGLLQQYLDNEMSFDDRQPFKESLFGNEMQMMIMRKILQQYKPGSDVKNNEKYRELLYELNKKRGRLWLITGGRGSGKTAFGWRICELSNKYYKEPICSLGPPVKVPKFVSMTTTDENKLPANCTVLVDEAGVQFMARKAGQNTDNIISKLPILRHSGRNVLFITQSTRLSDINIFRLADAIIFKSPSMFEFESERFKVDRQLAMFMPTHPKKVLYLTNRQLLTMTFNLPEWWNDEYSKVYAPFTSELEKYIFILKLLDDDLSLEQIAEQLGLRGTDMPLEEINQVKEMADYYGIDTLLSQPDNLVGYIKEGFDETSVNDLAESGPKKIFNVKWQMQNVQRKETTKRENKWTEDGNYAFKVNRNRWFLTDMKQATDDSNRTMAVMSALSEMRGIHKSNAAISLAGMMNPLFNKRLMSIKRICWNNDDVMDAAKNGKSGDTFIRDEHGFETGAGSGRAQTELGHLIEAIRLERMNFIFCGVSYKKEHAFDYILEPWGISKEHKLVKLLMLGKDLRPEGYITVSWTPETLWNEYNSKKREYLKKILSREAIKTRRVQLALDLLEDKDFPIEGSITDKVTYLTDIKGAKLTSDESKKVISLTKLGADLLKEKLSQAKLQSKHRSQ